MEFFDFLYDIYDKTKHKNYSIIFNVVNNTDFNVDRLKFDKKKQEEEDAVALIEYLKTDFDDIAQFTDSYCRNTCLIYNICHNCAAENYMINGTFSKYNKRNCGIKKIVALAVAELQGRLIIKNPAIFDNGDRLFYTIEAIKKIRDEYLPVYGKYFKEEVENPE